MTVHDRDTIPESAAALTPQPLHDYGVADTRA
jgi:hypothetical protein